MKYRFSVIAPHTDDEFLGCKRFFDVYGKNVDTVIFVSNGERDLTGFPDMPTYINIRREESEHWLSEVAPGCQIHYLNVPDNTSIEDIITGLGSRIFLDVNRKSVYEYLTDRMQKIVGDNIVLVPNAEKHPTHKFTFSLCEALTNKKIYYSVHLLMASQINSPHGTYYKKMRLLGRNFHNHYYVYSEDGGNEKLNSFSYYYPSQWDNFSKTGLVPSNWENYMSEVALKLSDEDHIYPIEGIKFKMGRHEKE